MIVFCEIVFHIFSKIFIRGKIKIPVLGQLLWKIHVFLKGNLIKLINKTKHFKLKPK